ncbi:MAG: type II toxin-antitoxin system Phd/YefM family antitoxin [Planctomycetaceae bacterium]|nr:type II toxin-antitoxin system Phd/YefM family antitoxin [Planctomycetaceae bacterium]
MIKISLSELKSHTGKYVEIAAGDETVYITKRGRPIAKIVSTTPDIMSLIGFLPQDVDLDTAREERLHERMQ